MKGTNNNLYDIVGKVRNYLYEDNVGERYGREEPLRSELYSSDQMRKHGQLLAGIHKLRITPTKDKLLLRLADNEEVLLEVRNLLAQTVKKNYLIAPAGEWLLDNFYLIEEQIRIAKKHLPKLYSEGLPQLSNGHSADLPRVYDIAQEIVSHSDGRVDMEILNNFLTAYQSVTSFQLGELWAVPIMLRLALIENLRRVSAHIALDRINRNLADYWADKLIETSENEPRNLILVIADMARSNPPLERAFVAEFIRQLRGKGPTLTQPLLWIEERLAEIGQTSAELVQIENQKQAADQVSVSNSIGSLKLLSSLDWREFVEQNSVIEHILCQDRVYPKMDFNTRDQYRRVIESIAKNSKTSEADVARIAITLTDKNVVERGEDHRSSHVGYFLIDKGLKITESLAGVKLPLGEWIRRKAGTYPLGVYLGGIFSISLGISAIISYNMFMDDYGPWAIIAVMLISLLCSSQLATALVNFIATLIARPTFLPRLDFSNSIPEEYSTLVAVPTLLTTAEDVEALVEALEVRFLANRNKQVRFGLLTDFTDSPTETQPKDKGLLALVTKRIEELNSKYTEDGNVFFLFHRPRAWNEREKVWMGYERKRGKLTDLNGLLRGNSKDKFSVIVGEQDELQKIKYVISLDSDTQLPRDTAWKIIATMAHPLNRPVYDPLKRIVIDGYGILQPRVSVSMPDTDSSLFSRMNGNEPGIDPYTRLTSDVYQDLFGEGSFIGKGIYDVDVFEKVLHDRFPENRILSHDLVEGCYVRSGLISDVQLYEKFPETYTADMQRRHRWIRGDWQVATWCLPFVREYDRRWHRNPLSALSRWKIFDNLRRSLVPMAFTTFVLISWAVLHSAAIWTLIVTSIIILPIVVSSIWDIIRKPKDLILSHHLILSSKSVGSGAVRTLFVLICLPYEAYLSLDAIFRTAWRMLISRRNLLQWVPSSMTKNKGKRNLAGSYLTMWLEPVLALICFVYISLRAPIILEVAGPILFLWLLAPAITWWLSRPRRKEKAQLSEEQQLFLQRSARRIWAFFEEFVTGSENWLPPDNYQEAPVRVIAHRTSPTNIGLSLLSSLTAYDFGYISGKQLLERTTGTLNTMQKMEKYRGHLYNWYDTLTLKPLYPRYISSVDSGNMAGHLITLRHGLLSINDDRIAGGRWIKGIVDTLEVVAEIPEGKNVASIKALANELAKQDLTQATVWKLHEILLKARESYTAITSKVIAPESNEAYSWHNAPLRQIDSLIEEIEYLAPWIVLQDISPEVKNIQVLSSIPTLYELSILDIIAAEEIKKLPGAESGESTWYVALKEALVQASKRANERIAKLQNLADTCIGLADIEYDFLYNKTKHLICIGYNVEEHRSDSSYYDLLASEARLSTFVGIAQGKIPQDSWFALGRLLTNAGGRPILLSWSGSMFEYLMPLLVMPSYDNTLLDQTDKAAVQRQIEYGAHRNIPWGISESGYNMIDSSMNYQYHAFGVPGLGLKRGLEEDLVIAPYATMLALMVLPTKACENLLVMAGKGFLGRLGFYEAIDYTPSRLPQGQSHAIVRSYMAHHHGMSLLSIAHLLLNKPMQRRFEAEPQFQATLLLLQERIPRATSLFAHTSDIGNVVISASEPQVRIINTPNTAVPEVQLLSNGNYHVMVTNSGGGYSKWRDLAVTRWREDTTCDQWGTFCYIRDLEDGEFWSSAYQPTQQKTKNFSVAFSQGRADYSIAVNKIETHTEVVVSPEDDIEMRRVTITNQSGRRRIIDITSYAEVVLAPPMADASHPAFSKLFVQTEILKQRNAIICTRRPRSKDERPPFMIHLMNINGKQPEAISYETDRAKFIGRGNTVREPDAMKNKTPLSGGEGPVLDPIVSIRYKIVLEPEETVSLDMIIGMSETREGAQAIIDKYQDKHHKDRVFELAWTHNQVILTQINASEPEAQLYSRLAGAVIFNNPMLRAENSVLIKNHKGQPGLWPYSISGDLPIVLLKIEETTDIELVKQVIQAHTFWRLKGLAVDLVIWNDSRDGYRHVLQNEIQSLTAAQPVDKPGGIFVRGTEQIANEDRVLFQTVARIVINSSTGSLADHIGRKLPAKASIPLLVADVPQAPVASSVSMPNDLLFFNGLGGFTPDGKEYVVGTSASNRTPAPWVNVLANPGFGTVISESGQSYTWSENAHEMRLTPWDNDPVSDTGGELFYLRDEETGNFWSPVPLPVSDPSLYITRHGFGYSVFEHEENGIHSEMTVYVDLNSPIKFSVIKLKNKSGRPRKITVTGYVDWILGDLKSKSAMHVVTELDPDSGALFARNPYNTEFPDRVAFFDVDALAKTFTGDRAEFVGRNGNLQNPAAMLRTRLSGKVGVGLDPCAAIQVVIDLQDGQEKEIFFKLGQGKNAYEASSLVRLFRGSEAIQEALQKVKEYWENATGALQVNTPDASVNILANGWLTYQTLACRVWGRSGYYQSGGAFGFRDQLQDVISLIHTNTDIARQQLLLCASRQFKEGDVQHWWHPPIGRGVRTRCSDDFLWLPFVAHLYVTTTGDTQILDEQVKFLEGRLLNPGEESYYDLANQSVDTASLYEHCIRAINHGLQYGPHGLPLIGSGDWNDGMDHVGRDGKGESVWLAFFLYTVLTRFKEIAQQRNDRVFATKCEQEAETLKRNIDKNAWDGNWYLRAYFDDGTPLGSHRNEECKIDAIAQSWSVLSGAGNDDKVSVAMESAYKYLVREKDGIIQLLQPPFDKSDINPGYIKGYVPGVRENGGQYTHGAIWLVMAFSKMGDNERAWKLLSMINPLNHGDSAERIATYKVEPYVMAADVYGASPHTGRGGWTWYTGSAGWMNQLIRNSLLGIKQEADKLILDPCVPAEWSSFSVRYRYLETFYEISFLQKHGVGVTTVSVDGSFTNGNVITLLNDKNLHKVEIVFFNTSAIGNK